MYAMRRLWNSPRFTIAAILSLALGIGGNATLFSVLYSALLRPLPYREANHLVVVWESHAGKGPSRSLAAPANFVDWQRQNDVFDGMALCQAGSQPVTITANTLPERIQSQYATAELFGLLGVHAAMGHTFFDREEQQTGRAVVLSHSFWHRRFADDPNIVGKSIVMSDNVYQIIGVMPKGFQIANFGVETDIWRQISMNDPNLMNRQIRWLLALGRLKPGVTAARAQSNLSTIARRLSQLYPQTNKDWDVAVEPLRQLGVAEIQKLSYPLIGAVFFVFLIACANVTGLLLARAANSKVEMAIRVALGARRRELFRQFLNESVLLALMGSLVGLCFALWSAPLLSAVAPARLSFLRNTAIDLPVCLFTLAIGVLAGVLIGVAVSLHASHPDPYIELKQGGRGTTSVATQRIRSSLTIFEVALAFLLLLGTGLLIRTLLNLSRVPLGFDPGKILTAQVDLSGPGYVKVAPRREIDMRFVDRRVETFYQSLVDRAGNLPGVDSVGLVSWLPMGGWSSGRRDRSFSIIGRSLSNPGEQPVADYNAVGGRYFEALHIPLLKGRYLDDRDGQDAPWVVVINEALAQRFWPGQDPLGKSLLLNIVAEEKPRTVVGIVGNVRQELPSFDSVPEMYVAFRQQPDVYPGHGVQNRLRMSIVVRTPRPMTVVPALRKIVAGLDGKQPLLNVQTMEEVVAASTAPARFFMRVLGLFGLMAVALALIGIYGLMSCNVAERTKEFGIRLALGAPRASVLRDVLGNAILLAACGAALGGLLSIWLNRILAGLLFGVRAHDLLSFAIVSFLLLVTAMLAALQPAWKAVRIDPIAALRAE